MSPISSVFKRGGSPHQPTHQAAIDDRASDDQSSSQEAKPSGSSVEEADNKWASKVPAEELSGVRESLLNTGRKQYTKFRGKYVFRVVSNASMGNTRCAVAIYILCTQVVKQSQDVWHFGLGRHDPTMHCLVAHIPVALVALCMCVYSDENNSMICPYTLFPRCSHTE